MVAAKKSKKVEKLLRVQQVASRARKPQSQRAVLTGLGLRRIRHIVTLPDNPCTRGMVTKIPHLVKILD